MLDCTRIIFISKSNFLFWPVGVTLIFNIFSSCINVFLRVIFISNFWFHYLFLLCEKVLRFISRTCLRGFNFLLNVYYLFVTLLLLFISFEINSMIFKHALHSLLRFSFPADTMWIFPSNTFFEQLKLHLLWLSFSFFTYYP